MADSKKILRAVLATAYKMPATEIDQLLDDQTTDADGETLVLDKDKARIAELSKPKPGQTFQDGYKKAKGEVLSQFEADIKTKFEIDSDANGVELVEAVVSQKATGKTLTDDDVRRHPVFQTTEKAHKKALKEVEDTFQTKLKETETKFQKDQVRGKINSKALEVLGTLNPILPANTKVATNVQNAFLNSLSGYDYEIQDTGIVVLKDGKVVQDAHGHSVDFDKLVKDNAAEYFEFKANNGGSNGGNGKPGEGAGGAGAAGAVYPANITKPTNFEQVTKIVNDLTIKLEDRQTVLAVWEAEHQAGAGS